MNKKKNIFTGTSGWNYDHWKGTFYKENQKPDTWLGFYSEHFSTVEINNSFYQLPGEKTLRQWKDTVPGDFKFSVKASRYITHMKKLKDHGDALNTFFNRIELLGDKLGPVLFQLPPHWKVNLERLESFLGLLGSGFRYVFEFRDESWWQERVYDLLSEHKAAFCIFDLNRRLSPKKITTDFVYVRLHGPEDPYQGKYDKQGLAGWAGTFTAYGNECDTIYCYFDNDQKGYAVENAMELQTMI
jgi:uncharacterized protein YecE (DUF72 family)